MKKKIIFLHQNLVVGGAEELRLTILKYLDRNKFDITVCNIENNGAVGEEIEKFGFAVINLNRKCSFWDVRITFDIYKLIKKGRYDIVQTSLFYANLHGRLAAFMARAPMVISEEHNIYAWKNRHPLFIQADRFLSKFTYMIITCSDSVKRFTSKQERIPPEKFLAIHNCVDANKFSLSKTKEDLRTAYGFRQEEKIIIIVGKLGEQKGHKYLLQAFKQTRDKIPNARLLIIGSGPLESSLRNQSHSLGFQDAVIFMGERRDIPELLQMSDLFVLPSLWEGFGIVLLEAMICGLPVIASNVDGIPEIVLHNKTGILVPPGDSQSLARAAIDLLLDINTRREYGINGRERVLKYFTPQLYIAKLTELYNQRIL